MRWLVQICGAKLSVRFNEDIISLWNRNADSADGTVQKLQNQLRRAMRLPHFISMEYKRHETSLTDKSSFRNTQLWRSESAPTSVGSGGGVGLGGSSAGGPQASSASPPLAPAVSAMFSSVPSGPPLGVNARWGSSPPGGGGGGGAGGAGRAGGFGHANSGGAGGGMGNAGGVAKVWGKEGAAGGLPPARDLNSRWR